MSLYRADLTKITAQTHFRELELSRRWNTWGDGYRDAPIFWSALRAELLQRPAPWVREGILLIGGAVAAP